MAIRRHVRRILLALMIAALAALAMLALWAASPDASASAGRADGAAAVGNGGLRS